LQDDNEETNVDAVSEQGASAGSRIAGSDVVVLPSANNVGAEIRGVDIAAGVSADDFKIVRDALHRHSAVVLRNQNMTPGQQREFCLRFGPPEPFAAPGYAIPGYPDMLLISNILDAEGKPIGITDAGRMWHTDGHFQDRPTMYSMLHAIEVPVDEHGKALGETWIASCADAYDALPDDLRRRIDGLTGESTMAQAYRYYAARGLAKQRKPLGEEQKKLRGIHPVARTHPATGRKCIYVSAGQTECITGLSAEDSTALIEVLQQHIVQDRFIYRHQWQVGDLLMWDNCSAQHLAIADYALPQRRLMHRISVAGVATF